MTSPSYLFSIVCSLTLACICTIFMLSLTIIFTRKLFTNSEDHFKSLPFSIQAMKIAAIATCIFPLLCALSIVILMISQLSIGIDHVYTNQDAIYGITRTAFFVGISLWYRAVYVFMLARLINIFQDSVYSISTTVIFVHVMNIVFLLASTHTIYGFMYTDKYGSTPGVLLAASFIFFAAGLLHLGYAFNHRLFQLILMQRQTVVNPNSATESSLGEQQQRILSVIKKNTLLATIHDQVTAMMIKMTLFVVVSLISQGAYWPMGTYPVSDVYFVAVDVTLAVLFVAAPLCIYLTFKVNEDAYFKLCANCDAKCEALCQDWAQRKMNQRDMVPAGKVASVMSTHSISETEDEQNTTL